MDLKPIKCPECGADLKITEGQDVVVCEYCGTSISVKDVTGSSSGNNIDNLITLAKTALDGGNFKEAFDYYNRVLETQGTNSAAWFGKGIASGGLSHINDIRIDEMVVSFENAIRYSPAEKQNEIKQNAAIEINKAIMNMINNIKGGPEFFINPQASGGYSVSIGNIMGNVKQLADEAINAMEKAHEWLPDNKEISNNLQMIKSRMDSLNKNSNQGSMSFRQSPVNIQRRKSSFSLFKFIFFIAIVGIGYWVVKNYVLKDKTVNNIINRIQDEKKIKPEYSLINTSTQSSTICISIYTPADNDKDLQEINREVSEKYISKYNQIYINYFADKNSGDKNSNLQIKHNNEWIIEHAPTLNLTATYEFRAKDKYTRFYKYVNGNKIDLVEITS